MVQRTEIIFPCDLITQDEIHRLGEHAKGEIFSRCKSHLDDADIVIALLDGSQVDGGTAWEIYISANGETFFEAGKCYSFFTTPSSPFLIASAK